MERRKGPPLEDELGVEDSAEEEEDIEKDVLEKSREAGEDLNKNSSLEGCPLLPADLLPPSPCLSPGWGPFLPSRIRQEPLLPPLQPKQNPEMWRPWEADNGGRQAGKTRDVVSSAVGKDLNNSLECPSLLPTVLLPSTFITPAKPTFYAPSLPSPPQRRLLKAKKRSLGELVRRRQRLLSYQLNQTPPSTPCTLPEPDQSTLESGEFGGNRNVCLDLFPSWTPPVSSPQSWLPPSISWCPPTPSPGPPCPPTPWLSSNIAPPSPVYCDGCQRWGNLLTVTVSQSRAP